LMVEPPLATIGENAPLRLSVVKVEPDLKARVPPLVVPVLSESVKLHIPPLDLADGIGLLEKGASVLVTLRLISGGLIWEESVIRKLSGLGDSLNLVVGKKCLENRPEEALFKLRLVQALDEGKLPIVYPLDLFKSRHVVLFFPFPSRLDLVFEIMVGEKVLVVHGVERVQEITRSRKPSTSR